MEQFPQLANLGAFGAIVGWMLWRAEPRLERIERALERLTRAQMLSLLSRPDIDDRIKDQAREVLDETQDGNGHAYGNKGRR